MKPYIMEADVDLTGPSWGEWKPIGYLAGYLVLRRRGDALLVYDSGSDHRVTGYHYFPRGGGRSAIPAHVQALETELNRMMQGSTP